MGESAERPAGFFPIVDDELRRLAAARLAYERPGHSNDAIAPVPEAYLRLVGGDPGRPWHGGALFFAAAEAMRRILVDRARGKAPLEADGAPGGSISTTSRRTSRVGPTARWSSTRP